MHHLLVESIINLIKFASNKFIGFFNGFFIYLYNENINNFLKTYYIIMVVIYLFFLPHLIKIYKLDFISIILLPLIFITYYFIMTKLKVIDIPKLPKDEKINRN